MFARVRTISFVICLLATSLVAGEKQRPGQDVLAKAIHVASDRVLPSLVTIETYGGVATGARRGRVAGVSKPGVGPTTGLVISEDGYILTSSFNFRDKPPIITVILRDGSKHVAELRGRDAKRRLCLLKIDTDKKLTVPEVMPRDELRVGSWALSLGVGYGDFEPAVSVGIVSALDRYDVKAVQTDANISPANYGGPLLSIDGRLIGVCVPLHPTNPKVTAGVEWYDSGIGFAIPLEGLADQIEKMKRSKSDPTESDPEDSEAKKPEPDAQNGGQESDRDGG